MMVQNSEHTSNIQIILELFLDLQNAENVTNHHLPEMSHFVAECITFDVFCHFFKDFDNTGDSIVGV